MSSSYTKFTRVAALAALIATFSVPFQAQQHCGKERWSVKTGTDTDAGNVNLSNPQNTTIAELVKLTPPNPIPPNSRVGPTETTEFVLNAMLTDYKLEGGSKGDSDYHLVLQDDQNNTMVAEIPSPGCVADGSPFAAQIANARAEFDAQFTATTSFQNANNIPVQVTGVGFFDFAHGQHGAAPNVIELHPVLDIIFNPAAGTTAGPSDFIISLTPSPLNLIQGGSTSGVISAALTGGATAPPTLSVSGVPAGVSSHLTPSGSGKTTLTLAASSTAPTGSFPLTVTGTAAGKSHSQTVPLNISTFSSVPGTQQWEYQMITASSEKDVIDQANTLGAQEWELVSAVKVAGTPSWRAFFKRLKNNF